MFVGISFSACANKEKPGGAFLEMSLNWYTIQNELLPAVSATETVEEAMAELLASHYYEDEEYAYFTQDTEASASSKDGSQGVPSARNTYVAYRLIDLAEERGMTYAHDKISLYFTEQWLPAAARSEDLSVGTENMTDVLALLRLIDAVADTGRDSTAELSALLPLEKLESLFPQAMNSASASYFMTISDLCDIETLGFLQTVVPVDTALMRGRFDQMRESGALTLSELAAAYRITKAVRTVAPKDDPTLIDFYRKQIEGRGYRAEQSEILSRDEALSACADIFARMRAGELPVTGDELLMWNTLAFAMNSDEDYEEIGTEEEGRFDAEMERLESEWRELASVLQCEGGLFAATPGGAPSLFYSYAAYFSSLSA